MKLAEIEQEALGLSDRDRATLAAKLLDTLIAPESNVSNDEIEQREQELESQGNLPPFRTRSSPAASSGNAGDEGGLPSGCAARCLQNSPTLRWDQSDWE